MKPAKNNPDQLTFAVFEPPKIVQRGDEFVITPGKPLIWLTPKQFGAQFNKNEDTIYRWIDEGVIDEKYVEKSGFRSWRIAAEAVPVLRDFFNKLRGV